MATAAAEVGTKRGLDKTGSNGGSNVRDGDKTTIIMFWNYLSLQRQGRQQQQLSADCNGGIIEGGGRNYETTINNDNDDNVKDDNNDNDNDGDDLDCDSKNN